MDLFGLGATYGNDGETSSEEEGADKQELAGREAGGGHAQAGDDSSDGYSSDSSLDSAELRAREAEARLKDFGTRAGAAGAAKPATVLPSASSAFDEVDGPPDFLDPEAIRPLATSSTHAMDPSLGLVLPTGPAGKVKQAPGKDFDISKLAPPLKGQKREGEDSKHVIEGKAKRYRPEDGPEATQQYTALQIAALGGHVGTGGGTAGTAAGAAGTAGPRVPGPLPPPAEGGAAGAKAVSRAMPVSEFLDKGVGGTLLPRKGQDRKEKEKAKRAKGQSSVHGWKTEAEMALRQQFDS